MVGGDEVGFEAVDLVEVFEAHDGEGGAGEAVLAGVGGGTGLTCIGTRTRRFLRIGSVGSEARFGAGELLFRFRHRILSELAKKVLGDKIAFGLVGQAKACPTFELPRRLGELRVVGG